MKFSIIIPSYNNSKWLSKCIQSVLNQTYKNYEIIVVDDMSTDNSLLVAESLLGSPHKIISLRTKRLTGGTRNEGISYATGDYVLQIDSDDWLINEFVLEKINNYLNTNPVDVLYLGYKMEGADNSALVLNIDNKIDALKTGFSAGWLKAVKTYKYKDSLFPEGTLFEDKIQNMELAIKCNTFGSLGEITHIWNRNNENATTFNPKWCNYRFEYVGELYRLILECEDKEIIDYLMEELNLYMSSIKLMVSDL